MCLLLLILLGPKDIDLDHSVQKSSNSDTTKDMLKDGFMAKQFGQTRKLVHIVVLSDVTSYSLLPMFQKQILSPSSGILFIIQSRFYQN
jgi:hypothetical protein